MKFPLFSIALLLSMALCHSTVAQTTDLEKAHAILKRVPLIDVHNDTPWQYRKRVQSDLDRIDLSGDTTRLYPPMHTDMRRLKAGQLGAQFWSVFLPTDQPNVVGAFHNQVRLTKALIERYPLLVAAKTADEIESIHGQGKVASLMGVEGGHALGPDGSLAELRWLYGQGVRYMTLTHTDDNAIADSANGRHLNGGLSAQGRKVVQEMNRLGVIIDLSHTSDDTARQTLALTSKPVLFTHSDARALNPHERNVPDDILRKLKDNKGVIMLSFVPDFVHKKGQKKATLHDVADHFDYVKKLIGVDHIGVGGDFDGIKEGPKGLEDVSKYPALFAELLHRGWTSEELEKVAGLNVLRVMRANEAP